MRFLLGIFLGQGQIKRTVTRDFATLTCEMRHPFDVSENYEIVVLKMTNVNRQTNQFNCYFYRVDSFILGRGTTNMKS